MKNKIHLLCFFFFSIHFSFAQSGQWAWVNGDTVATSPGHYGIKGVADPANRPPGLYEAYNWTDANGNFWIYGGYNSISALCADMWMYNPFTNLWTWMQGDSTRNVVPVRGTLGVPSPLNTPGSRNTGVSWVDTSGNFWLYGGFGNALAMTGDLWMFNTVTLEWTWMSGSTNTNTTGTLVLGVPSTVNYPPSTVETTAGWVDNQNQLWFFGGMYTNTCCPYDRVLRYSISTNEWTWMRGSANSQAPTFWGTMGVASPANNPGGRSVYAHWKDQNGNFWFANGYNYAEVWKYDPVTNEWTWMAGSQVQFNMGNYVSYCDTTLGNTRSHTEENKACYKDRNNQVWEFGGTTANTNYNLNDLWIFDDSSLKYKWMHGTNLFNQAAVYGTLGVASASNVPHSCDGALMFGDTLCHVFLFGGLSRQPAQATYNALWKFIPDSSCSKCLQNVPLASFSAPNLICPGTCTDFTNLSSNATSFLWLFPGANPSTSADYNPTNICYNSPGSYDVTLIASSANVSDTITLTNFITVYPYPPPQGIIQSGDTLFANAGAVSYQWYYNGTLIPGATDSFYVATESGNFNVVATDTDNCEVEAAIFDVVAGVESVAGSGSMKLFPNPVYETLYINSKLYSPGSSISIYNVLDEKVTEINMKEMEVQKNILFDVSFLSPGMYILKINRAEQSSVFRFIKK